jgi:hypothetical protein
VRHSILSWTQHWTDFGRTSGFLCPFNRLFNKFSLNGARCIWTLNMASLSARAAQPSSPMKANYVSALKMR